MKKFVPVLLASVAAFRPFDTKAGWKTVKVKAEDGSETEAVALKDGNPIWIDADGSERTLGADTITRLNGEAAGHRKRAEDAEAKLKTFDGLDAEKARGALDTVSKLDQKKLIDAGEVDKVKDSMRTEFQGLVDAEKKRADEAVGQVSALRRSNAFGGSKFIADKLSIPRDIVESVFGKNFHDENGNLVAKYNNGDKIMSKAKIGEVADFDEALSLLVEAYPNKDSIMKGNNHGGSGGGGGGGGQAGKVRYSRNEYGQLPPTKQAEIAKDITAGKAELTD